MPDGTSIGSKEKADLEDYLHEQVCDGSMLLADAQLSIARDWVAAWERAGRPYAGLAIQHQTASLSGPTGVM